MVPEEQQDLNHWCAAFESYTVQSKKIEKVFDFVAKIGQGSFGSVYKAQVKVGEKIYQNETQANPPRPVISATDKNKFPSKSLNINYNDGSQLIEHEI